MKKSLTIFLFIFTLFGFSQTDARLYEIIDNVSAKRIEQDVTRLANFKTRNTFSDTLSETEGIGAARRWITSEFETISKTFKNCGRCNAC